MSFETNDFHTVSLVVTSVDIFLETPAIPTDDPSLLIGGEDNDNLQGAAGENLLLGAAGDDDLRGGDGDDILQGGDGRDELIGENGNDELLGGAGFDTGVWRFPGHESFVDGLHVAQTYKQAFQFDVGATGVATRADGLETDVFSDVEMIQGSLFGNTFNATAEARPTDGGDFIYFAPNSGDDVIVNDGGQIMVDYRFAKDGAHVDLQAGFAKSMQPWPMDGVGNDTLEGIHAVIGSHSADHIVGSNQSDIIAGAGGRDEIFGAGGDDILYGGQHRLDGVFSESYSGSSNARVFGGAGDDEITGGFFGGVLVGGLGNDRIEARNEHPQKSYGFQPREYVHELYGGAGDDLLIAGEDADVLSGGEGDDWLTLGDLRNTADGGDGRDMADFSDISASVKINLDAGFFESAGCRFDALENFERAIGTRHDDVLIGTNLGNFLGGGDGDDIIVGRDGKDAMAGGLGDDTFAVQQVGDEVFEKAGEGFDWINTWVDYRNAENVEGLNGRYAESALKLLGNGGAERIFGSEHDDKIDGWRGDDWVAGLGGADYLNGGAGDDLLFGNGGDDVLRGGGGDDRMAGQSGADRFVHRAGDGDDLLVDFAVGQDVLDLSGHGLANFYEFRVAARDVGDDVLIYLGDGGSLLLQGVSELDLSADDVIL